MTEEESENTTTNNSLLDRVLLETILGCNYGSDNNNDNSQGDQNNSTLSFDSAESDLGKLAKSQLPIYRQAAVKWCGWNISTGTPDTHSFTHISLLHLLKPC